MTHPLDEAIAEARRAIALDAKMVATVKDRGLSVPPHLALERDRFIEKWTRIEKALVEARDRDDMATALREACNRGRATLATASDDEVWSDERADALVADLLRTMTT